MIRNNSTEELFELILIDEEDGVFANSLVAAPAIERDFFAFSKEFRFTAVNDEKMLIAGPMLVPNKKILRLKENGEKYWVYFKPETIELISRRFNKKKLGSEVTLEHGNKTSGVHMVENWLVDHPTKDKSNLYGFTLPRGSWFAIYSVEDNPKVWERVKSGEFNGFSIEGIFENRKSNVSLSLDKDIEEFTEEEAELFLGQIKALIKKDKRFGKGERIEMQAYSDYPQSMREAGRIAREQNEKVGNKCMTLTGKRRAADLEAGRPLSRDTIARMVSYLSRAKSVYEQNKSDRESCSYIAYKGWGGETALTWAENKLKQIDMEAQPSITSSYPGEVASGSIAPALK